MPHQTNRKNFKPLIIPSSASGEKEHFETINGFIPLISHFSYTDSEIKGAIDAASTFPFKAPNHFLDLVDNENVADPLLKQVLPKKVELEEVEGFKSDPVGDLTASKNGGIIHKYKNRVLLITTQSCAIHCRFCFRRNFPYSQNSLKRSNWDIAIDYINSDKDIDEVILSGGDPLTLSNNQIFSLINRIEQIEHIKIIRFHTRIPVVNPVRIDHQFLTQISSVKLKVVMIIHTNHLQEIDFQSEKAIKELNSSGVTLLSQSVLLSGINDDVDTLSKLFHHLFFLGVLPYYLHLLDRAKGVAHFEVDAAKTQLLIQQLQKSLPGYLMPRVVREISGKSSKTQVTSENLELL
jgi:EF-P beta-lysylation protein EpmB